MMKDNKTNANRQVHFANGFPSKGLVQAVVPYGRPSYTSAVGHYVSLDEVSPGRVGRTHWTIPPLAKGRGQFCSVRNRQEDDRYRRRPDPFKLPKAAEKTGFSASQIKRAKPKMMRLCRSTEPPSSPPGTSGMYNQNMARRSVYSTPPNRPLEIDFEDDVVPPSVELKSKNKKIISDVEKESIQAELAGLGEVYQRVCHGKMESLYSLLYPSRREAKRGTVQYINTSAPVPLRTPKITHHVKKLPKEQSSTTAKTEETNDAEKTMNEENGSSFPFDSEAKQVENNARPILIPLPYIRSDTGLTSPAKQQNQAYHVPYIYNSKNSKAVVRPSHMSNKTATPAVINFNPMNIPALNRPGTKNGPVAGGAITAPHTTTNVAAEDNPIPAPFVTPSPYKGTTPNQTPALVDGKSDLYSKLDVESVDSETDFPAAVVSSTSQDNERDNKGEEIALDQEDIDNAENITMEEIVTRGIRLSLTTVGGVQRGVEIYDYDKRDIDSEQQAAKHIQELEEIGEKKMKEYKELLEEHQHILDEVKHLEEDLHNKPNE